MCGIAGRFHPIQLPPDPEWHERADALLAHRGPDGQGHHADDRCELVHRRLALIDLSPAGAQPMSNEDGSILVVFNGEIYNHQDLRAELQARGHLFRSTADTEVLVHLYEDSGQEMVQRLRGIFAFAIYDQRRCRLLLARDRFGVKPLYYTTLRDQWVFASEIKAILAGASVDATLDRQACYDFLGLGYIPEPATGFKGIQALSPGTTLEIDPEGQRHHRYHRISADPNSGATLPRGVDRVSHALLQAVDRQSVADVPVAALLSGGIDSSLVVAAYSRASGTPPTTFNVRFPDPRHDETCLALAVSKHCRTHHHVIDLGEEAITPASVTALLTHFDQPFADTSLLPMYWISRAVRRRGIICTLSGDGGDEAFGGYARFWRATRLMQLANLPSWMRSGAVRAGSHLARWTRDWGRQLAKAASLAEDGRASSAALIAGLSNYLSEHQKQQLTLEGAARELLPVDRYFDGNAPPGTSDLEVLSQRMTENLFAVGLPSDMLRKVDMMSMLAGIEVRVPLLDEEVVTVGLGLPHRLKTDSRRGKLVLRALADQWLPAEVGRHPKHGFTIPLDRMLPADFHEMLRDVLLGADARIRTVLNVELIRDWLNRFRNVAANPEGGSISRAGLYQRVFIVLALELWLRRHRLSW